MFHVMLACLLRLHGDPTEPARELRTAEQSACLLLTNFTEASVLVFGLLAWYHLADSLRLAAHWARVADSVARSFQSSPDVKQFVTILCLCSEDFMRDSDRWASARNNLRDPFLAGLFELQHCFMDVVPATRAVFYEESPFVYSSPFSPVVASEEKRRHGLLSLDWLYRKQQSANVDQNMSALFYFCHGLVHAVLVPQSGTGHRSFTQAAGHIAQLCGWPGLPPFALSWLSVAVVLAEWARRPDLLSLLSVHLNVLARSYPAAARGERVALNALSSYPPAARSGPLVSPAWRPSGSQYPPLPGGPYNQGTMQPSPDRLSLPVPDSMVSEPLHHDRGAGGANRDGNGDRRDIFESSRGYAGGAGGGGCDVRGNCGMGLAQGHGGGGPGLGGGGDHSLSMQSQHGLHLPSRTLLPLGALGLAPTLPVQQQHQQHQQTQQTVDTVSAFNTMSNCYRRNAPAQGLDVPTGDGADSGQVTCITPGGRALQPFSGGPLSARQMNLLNGIQTPPVSARGRHGHEDPPSPSIFLDLLSTSSLRDIREVRDAALTAPLSGHSDS